MEAPHNNNNDDEIPEFDAATQNLVNAAMATAAAFAARTGIREAVQALVTAALALALAGFLPGLRFQPKDEELVGFYLRKKARQEAVPVADMMREANVMLHSPMTIAETLPRLGDREWYFFTPRLRKYRRGVRPDRGTDGGYWKATGADKKVCVDGEIVGFKKSLVFYMGGGKKVNESEKTKWIMYEYRLNEPPRIQESEDDMRLDDWVLCSIHEQPQAKARGPVAGKRKHSVTVTPPVDVGVDVNVDVDVDVDVEQENYADLEQQPSTSTSVEADQYRYEHDQYLQQQQQMPTLDVVEQEQYAYHLPLPTTLQVPVIDQHEQYAQQPSTEQYRYNQPYLEQQPMTLINNNNNNATTSAGVEAEAEAKAEQYYRTFQQDMLEQLPSDNSFDPSLDPGLNFDWMDFLNFNNPDECLNGYMSMSSSVTSTTYSDEASVQHQQQSCPCQNCQLQHQPKG